MNRRGVKRPLYVVGFAFALSLLAASVIGFHAACAAALLCAVLFAVALAVRTLRQHEGVTAALAAMLAAFSLFVAWEYTKVQPLQSMDGKTVTVTVWIEEKVSEHGDTVAYYARVRDGALPHNTRLLVVADNLPEAPQLYERVTADVKLTATDDWRAHNVFLRTWIAQCERTPSNERPWNYPFLQFRTYLIDHLETRVGGDAAALLRAVCFGDKSRMGSDIKSGFAAAGLSHITAVSGFHMNVISLALFHALCFLGLRKRWAALLSLPFPAAFAVLTGMAPSALRAGVMCTVMLLGASFRRTADARNSLGAALLLLLAFDPGGVYDIGLQLSAAATLGILLTASLQSRDKTGVWYKTAHGLQLTVAAVIATLPISALTFGETSALAPLTNLIAQPLASVAMSCGCFGTLLLSVPWLAFLGSALVLAAGVAAKGMLFIADLAAGAPWAMVPLDQPYLMVWALAVPFALLFGWHLLKGRGLRITAMLLVIALCVSAALHHIGMRGVTTVTACSTESGTVVILKRDGHSAAVVLGDVATETVRYTLERHKAASPDFVLFQQEKKAAYIDATATKDLVLCEPDAWTTAPRTVTFWEDTSLRFLRGWCRLTVGEYAVLIVPCDGNVADLPKEYRTAAWAIFDREPPRGVEKLALAQAVLCCPEEHLPQVTRDMMWGVYPIDIAANEAVTMKLR